jgi:hypothetical protein
VAGGHVSRLLAARVLSIVGHPGLLMPVAVALGAIGAGVPAARVQAVVAAAVGVAAVVGAYSLWQVRRGRWTHVDASLPHERRQLNPFVLLLLFGAAVLLAATGASRHGAIGAAVSGLLVLAALALQRWMKMSLHAAFAVFAAALVWPHLAWSLPMLALALGVAWSRLVLGRHTPAEVLTGLLLGALAGLAFHAATALVPAVVPAA